MSRFLGCGCAQRSQSELEPIVWAGYGNEWRRIPEMTDEFCRTSLNSRKWLPYSPYSFGTKPGLFVPSNVYIRDQVLHLSAKCEGLPQGAPPGYAKWTTSAMVSPNGKHKELVYMDARFSQKSSMGQIENVNHPIKKMIFDMPANPVTVGIDWTPDYLKTYVDGHVIRHLENKHWHSPMRICLKLETSPEEFELPEHRNLAAREDFEIYYMRTWHRCPSKQQLQTPGIINDE